MQSTLEEEEKKVVVVAKKNDDDDDGSTNHQQTMMKVGLKSFCTIVSEDSSVAGRRVDDNDDDDVVVVTVKDNNENRKRSTEDVNTTQSNTSVNDCGEETTAVDNDKEPTTTTISQPTMKKSRNGDHSKDSTDEVTRRGSDDESNNEGTSNESDDQQKERGEEYQDDEDHDDDDEEEDEEDDNGFFQVDLEGEEEHDVDDEALFRRLLAAARSQGISLQYLASQYGLRIEGLGDEDDDDEPVEYPFERPPHSLDDVAAFIQSEKCKRILVLAGAGMSVASGIPDFRSSNGLYATLDASTLTASMEEQERIRDDPSYSLDQHLFLENPLPCLEVNREFILGVQRQKWKATLAHRFVELLRSKTGHGDGDGTSGTGKLVRLYTQNIDGLEDQCHGLGHHRRIAVHGSMDEAECAVCLEPMDFDEFCHKVKTQIKDITGQDSTAPKESTPIRCKRCGAYSVKPSIVLFRSRLPDSFFQNVPHDVEDVDLLIVMGTSLAVAPANTVVMRVPKTAMRVLINRDPVGRHLGFDWEYHDRDYFARGNCETVVLDLMEKLGWLEELRPLLVNHGLPESSAALLRERFELVQQDSSSAASSTSCSDDNETRRANNPAEDVA